MMVGEKISFGKGTTMAKSRFFRLVFSGVLLVVISGCSYPISKGLRQEAAKDVTFAKVLASTTSYHGNIVIWGGVVIEAVKRAEGTDLFLWETPPDFLERPKGREFAEGMFIARSRQLLDPETYAAGLKVTVGGEIIGEELGKWDTMPYVYPVVRIKELYLWKPGPSGYKWSWGNTPYYWPEQFSPDIKYKPLR